ncbi:hypothetical protein ACLB2K_044786 [Fragaria x ananassa]
MVRRSANFESPSMDDSIVSPVVGLQSYNAQSECWFQLRPSAPAQTIVTNLNPCGVLEKRLRTLEETASVMARAIVSTGVVVIPELVLEILNDIVVNLEGLGENIKLDRRFGAENCVGYGDDTWVLAAKTGNGHGFVLSDVELEVNKTNREDKHISRVQHFGE